MMKVKFICDRKYGGKYDKNGNITTMDCTFFDGKLIDTMVRYFSSGGELEVTCSFDLQRFYHHNRL